MRLAVPEDAASEDKQCPLVSPAAETPRRRVPTGGTRVGATPPTQRASRCTLSTCAPPSRTRAHAQRDADKTSLMLRKKTTQKHTKKPQTTKKKKKKNRRKEGIQRFSSERQAMRESGCQKSPAEPLTVKMSNRSC